MSSNESTLKKALGVTHYALYTEASLPVNISYEYYEKYVKVIEKLANGKEKSKRELNFKYISGFTLNGKSFVNDLVDHIWIEEGVIIQTYHMFSEILSFNTFSDFVEPNKEIANIKLFYQDTEGINEHETNYRTSIIKERKIIAEYLSMFATKFIILHEIGHHFNGHILFLHNELNTSKLEIDNYKNKIEPLVIQTLEMDADAFAISQLARELSIFMDKDPLLKITLKNRLDILGICIYSLSCLYKLISNEKNDNYQSLKESKYLPCSLRYLNNLECLKTNLLFLNIVTEEEFEEVAKKYMLLAESEFSSIFTEHYDWKKNFKYINSTVGQLRLLKSKWKEIRDNLDKYARCNLAK
ncbi:hypothetical protein MKZ20_21725 [Psychrobacillus sp. FSL K6-2684]|uniref:hypothetical protein n=1 Tax=unclassified Psychrobacillus TaxID=2636677 RepID=UPI0030FCBD7B